MLSLASTIYMLSFKRLVLIQTDEEKRDRPKKKAIAVVEKIRSGLEIVRQEEKAKEAESSDDEFQKDMEKLFSMFRTAKEGMMQQHILKIGDKI